MIAASPRHILAMYVYKFVWCLDHGNIAFVGLFGSPCCPCVFMIYHQFGPQLREYLIHMACDYCNLQT